ncbi:MAG: heparinase II/III family protein [Alphaproteobacteria bacterium]
MAGDKITFFRRILALARRPARQTLGKLCYALGTLIFATPAYPLTLVGRTPTRLRVSPADPWPGDAARGRAVLKGEFTFAGRTLRAAAPEAPPPAVARREAFRTLWLAVGVSPAWRAELHGFSWLRDLRVAGGETARLRARELVACWIDGHDRWHRLAWRPDVLASRLCAWLGHYEFLCADADADFHARFFHSLSRQARHLARVVPGGLADACLLLAIKGLVYSGVCLPGGERRLNRALKLLEREVARQVLGDGGHIERSPSLQLSVLRDLVDIRAALLAGQREVPAALLSAIDRMAPMLRFFRHGDGGLALLNDSNEEEAWLIDMVLTHADAKGKPLASAPHSGFERFANNRTLVIADVGAPPPGAEDHTHAGTLSFEMSLGKERLIVNCGAGAGSNPALRRRLRATAAHSTVTVEDTDSTEIFEGGGLGGFLGRRPATVACQREEADGAVWIDASHDGYLRPFGVVHRRRLYLSASGEDLRGEDTLAAATAGKPPRREFTGRKFAVRFHLHPQVKASLVRGGGTALLRLPSGDGWRLRASGGELGLEDSVYLGARGEVQRTDQIVISGEIGQTGAQVKWAVRRVADTS